MEESRIKGFKDFKNQLDKVYHGEKPYRRGQTLFWSEKTENLLADASFWKEPPGGKIRRAKKGFPA